MGTTILGQYQYIFGVSTTETDPDTASIFAGYTKNNPTPPSFNINQPFHCRIQFDETGAKAGALGTTSIWYNAGTDSITGSVQITVANAAGEHIKIVNDPGNTIAEQITIAGAGPLAAGARGTPVDGDYMDVSDASVAHVPFKSSWQDMQWSLQFTANATAQTYYIFLKHAGANLDSYTNLNTGAGASDGAAVDFVEASSASSSNSSQSSSSSSLSSSSVSSSSSSK